MSKIFAQLLSQMLSTLNKLLKISQAFLQNII